VLNWIGSSVSRLVQTQQDSDLLTVAQDFAQQKLAPVAADCEDRGEFPRALIRELGALGLLTLPYSEIICNDQDAKVPYTVSLQVLEEISRAWLTAGMSMSVHHLACAPLIKFGTVGQKERWQDTILSGATLGAYCLSEPGSGSDAAAMTTQAVKEGSTYRINGTKAWITHAGIADFYTVMARTGVDKTRGISCFYVPANTPGLEFGAPEHKMGGNASPTGLVHLNDVLLSSEHLIGQEGQGFPIALASLDIGRLGIAAGAVGLAQAALDAAIEYSGDRMQFGQAIDQFQGVGFMLADMATAIATARSTYLDAAQRLDHDFHFGSLAAISKLAASDAAMKATTDAVQIFGANGYTKDYSVERYMREAKVLQIVEGTNQIQRVVIFRSLSKHVG
jgi:alkylation response protein AidB-like acyl-CoA dehydrogenase